VDFLRGLVSERDAQIFRGEGEFMKPKDSNNVSLDKGRGVEEKYFRFMQIDSDP